MSVVGRIWYECKIKLMNREFGIKVVKLMAWVALGFAVGCHLWAANRGLEMTDEASYLLIALDPWHTWGHGTFQIGRAHV